MFFKLTDDFIKDRDFRFKEILISKNFYERIKLRNAHKELSKHNFEDYFLFCEFCRKSSLFGCADKNGKKNSGPIYCPYCGETSPIYTFHKKIKNIQKIIHHCQLITNTNLIEIFLEQIIVLIVTGLEIFFRKTYAILQDQKHIIYGESILNKIYAETRNEFLNFGVTCKKFKKDFKIDIKLFINNTNDFQKMCSVYFKRHIIVHNAGIIDIDYISQTGCKNSFLGSHISISMDEIKEIIIISTKIIEMMEKYLNKSILKLIDNRLTLNSTQAFKF